MTVISVTITQSTAQVISGIPKTVKLETNIPASIFYTLDGSTPTVDSTIYTDAIVMPTNVGTVTLKVFATNGESSSAILSETYQTSLIGQRKSHATVVTTEQGSTVDNFPFSSPLETVGLKFGNTGGVFGDSVAVDNLDPGGYDADGNHIGGSDKLPRDYDIIYSTTDRIGRFGKNIGRLPKVTIKKTLEAPTSSNIADKLFNPKAFVIYQSYDNPPPNENGSYLNRMTFSLDSKKAQKTPGQLYSIGLESPAATGSFLRQHFNPRTNEITYYYLDSSTCRWIISTEKYVPGATDTSQLHKVVFSSRDEGAGYVFRWTPFIYHVLV